MCLKCYTHRIDPLKLSYFYEIFFLVNILLGMFFTYSYYNGGLVTNVFFILLGLVIILGLIFYIVDTNKRKKLLEKNSIGQRAGRSLFSKVYLSMLLMLSLVILGVNIGSSDFGESFDIVSVIICVPVHFGLEEWRYTYVEMLRDG